MADAQRTCDLGHVTAGTHLRLLEKSLRLNKIEAFLAEELEPVVQLPHVEPTIQWQDCISGALVEPEGRLVKIGVNLATLVEAWVCSPFFDVERVQSKSPAAVFACSLPHQVPRCGRPPYSGPRNIARFKRA